MSHLNPQSRFAEFIDDFGQPETSRPVSAATLEKYRGKLPDRQPAQRSMCHFAAHAVCTFPTQFRVRAYGAYPAFAANDNHKAA